jgi:sarcosine oxidase
MASPEAPAYTPLMQRAYALWGELAAEWGGRLIETVGAVYVAPPDQEIVAGAVSSYREADIPHEVLEAKDARKRFPWLTIEADEIAVVEPDAGVLQPEDCLRAHQRGARAAGAEIRIDEALTDWQADTSGVTVETAHGRYAADHLILALGSWMPDFVRFRAPLAVERQVVAIYEAPPRPIFVAPAAEAECVYGLPEAGPTYKVALHHGGAIGHPEKLAEAVSDADLALIRNYVRHRLPGLPPEPAQAYTCRYTNAPDRQFLLGPHPDHARVIVAAGCSGRGYKFASAIGEVLAQFCGGAPDFDIAACAPGRFAAATAQSGSAHASTSSA